MSKETEYTLTQRVKHGHQDLYVFFWSYEFIMKYIVVVQHKSPSLVWISDLESWFSIFRLPLLFRLCFGALENLA